MGTTPASTVWAPAAVHDAVERILGDLGLELYDLELTGAPGRARRLVVLVDRAGGVDLDTVTAATEALSPALDRLDALRGSYTLEVSSPGLERPLRTPQHWERALGEVVTVKLRHAGVPQRSRGVVVAADADGADLEVDGETVRVGYDEVTSAHTVFEWGPTPKPGGPRRTGRGGRRPRGGR